MRKRQGISQLIFGMNLSIFRGEVVDYLIVAASSRDSKTPVFPGWAASPNGDPKTRKRESKDTT